MFSVCRQKVESLLGLDREFNLTQADKVALLVADETWVVLVRGATSIVFGILMMFLAMMAADGLIDSVGGSDTTAGHVIAGFTSVASLVLLMWSIWNGVSEILKGLTLYAARRYLGTAGAWAGSSSTKCSAASGASVEPEMATPPELRRNYSTFIEEMEGLGWPESYASYVALNLHSDVLNSPSCDSDAIMALVREHDELAKINTQAFIGMMIAETGCSESTAFAIAEHHDLILRQHDCSQHDIDRLVGYYRHDGTCKTWRMFFIKTLISSGVSAIDAVKVAESKRALLDSPSCTDSLVKSLVAEELSPTLDSHQNQGLLH